jgi:hypothetical protein
VDTVLDLTLVLQYVLRAVVLGVVGAFFKMTLKTNKKFKMAASGSTMLTIYYVDYQGTTITYSTSGNDKSYHELFNIIANDFKVDIGSIVLRSQCNGKIFTVDSKEVGRSIQELSDSCSLQQPLEVVDNITDFNITNCCFSCCWSRKSYISIPDKSEPTNQKQHMKYDSIKSEISLAAQHTATTDKPSLGEVLRDQK